MSRRLDARWLGLRAGDMEEVGLGTHAVEYERREGGAECREPVVECWIAGRTKASRRAAVVGRNGGSGLVDPF
jgi:hypothetical protein